MIVMQSRVAIGQCIYVHHKYSKITIQDGGSTAQYSVYIVYKIQTAFHCLNSSMYAYIYIVREV